jgi:palmitoyltransferase
MKIPIHSTSSPKRDLYMILLIDPDQPETTLQSQSERKPHSIITYPLPRQNASDGPKRTFAVIQTRPTDNVWNIGTMGNLKTVMGDSIVDWILPVKFSPCCRHDDPESDFALGRDWRELKRLHGIT